MLSLVVVPAVLAFGVLWFNDRQSSAAQRDSDQQARTNQAIALDNRRSAVLDSYLNYMSDLVLNHGLLDNPKPSVVAIAQARTSTALQRLDAGRKGQVLDFLQQLSLISKQHLSIVDLSGIGLSYTDLSGLPLSGFQLAGANLSHANFTGSLLVGADLQNANLQNANLSKADLAQASLKGADLDFARLNGARAPYVNLRRARLIHADLSGAILDGAGERAVACRLLATDRGLRGLRRPISSVVHQ